MDLATVDMTNTIQFDTKRVFKELSCIKVLFSKGIYDNVVAPSMLRVNTACRIVDFFLAVVNEHGQPFVSCNYQIDDWVCQCKRFTAPDGDYLVFSQVTH